MADCKSAVILRGELEIPANKLLFLSARDINVRSYITRGAGDPREQVMLKIVVFNDQMLNKYDKTMNINLFLRFL